MSSGLNWLPPLLVLVFLFNEHIVLPFPAKKFLSVFDDCLIREIGEHIESSHPADEYNSYKISLGCQGLVVFLVVD